MSGTGKSHWSSRLVQRGFKLFCCDELIAEKLKPQLTTANGKMLSMGQWMGFPYETHYRQREAQYLRYEVEVLTEVLDYLEREPHAANQDTIIDTTGSVIYVGEALLERLRRLTTVVYLDTPLEVQKKMCSAYVANPPPVLWRDRFSQSPGESNRAALARSYPGLLAARTREYKKLADVTLDYYLLRQAGFSLDDFLNKILQALEFRAGVTR
jgi:shikimate kinase